MDYGTSPVVQRGYTQVDEFKAAQVESCDSLSVSPVTDTGKEPGTPASTVPSVGDSQSAQPGGSHGSEQRMQSDQSSGSRSIQPQRLSGNESKSLAAFPSPAPRSPPPAEERALLVGSGVAGFATPDMPAETPQRNGDFRRPLWTKTRGGRSGAAKLLWGRRMGVVHTSANRQHRPPSESLHRSAASALLGFCCGPRFVTIIALSLLSWLGVQIFLLNRLLPTLNIPEHILVPPLPNGFLKAVRPSSRRAAAAENVAGPFVESVALNRTNRAILETISWERQRKSLVDNGSYDATYNAAINFPIKLSGVIDHGAQVNEAAKPGDEEGAAKSPARPRLRRRDAGRGMRSHSEVAVQTMKLDPRISSGGLAALPNPADDESDESIPSTWFLNKTRVFELYSPSERFALVWSFLLEDKQIPYVANEDYLSRYFPNAPSPLNRYWGPTLETARAASTDPEDVAPKMPFQYYNTLAVFPGANEGRLHGFLGFNSSGTKVYKLKPRPPPAAEIPGGVEAALKDGGFYRALSDSISLDRQPLDSRQDACKQISYEARSLEDASVIIVFFNEAPSTLLRSLHSILNQTPPLLLREIILVDDHSTVDFSRPGGFLENYVKLLPKVKLMRLPERRGIVPARLSGIGMAQAPVVVVLDSHIEVGPGWLEPQLQRLRESPKSVVFPLILSLDPQTFNFITDGGVGCFLSFHWKMTERPYFQGVNGSPDVVPSPSMAGGLFAVRKDWFDEIGGYDTGMGIWGSENVEMGFRTWQCGGRLECTPCAIVYHVFREKGFGYSTPENSSLINVLRTARVWTDEYYQLVAKFNGRTIHPDKDPLIGNIDRMLLLKQQLNCKSFNWYLENVDPDKKPRRMEDIVTLGAFVNKGYPAYCLDCMGHRSAPDKYDIYPCHFMGGNQAFFTIRNNSRIYTVNDETVCLSSTMTFTECQESDIDEHWEVNPETGQIIWSINETTECLSILPQQSQDLVDQVTPKLGLQPCAAPSAFDEPEWKGQFWNISRFVPDPNFALPSLSPAAIARQERLEKRQSESLKG